MTARAVTGPGPPGLARNSAWQLASGVARAGILLLAVAAYTRLLGMPQWGLLALAQTLVAPLALLDAFGSATVKFVAEAVARRDATAAGQAVRAALGLGLAVGVAGAAGIAVAAPWFATSVFAVPPEDVARAVACFRVIGATWLVGLVTSTFVSVLAAHQAFAAVARLAVLGVFLAAAAGVAAAALWRDATAVLLAQAAAALALAFLAARRGWRLLPAVGSASGLDRRVVRGTLAFGGWQLLATGGVVLAGLGDRYVLAAVFVPTVLGHFALAQALVGQLQAAFYAMGDVLLPAVSRLQGQGDLTEARRLALLASWALTLVFAVFATALGVVGGDFLALWIAPEVAAEVQGALRLLCAGAILWTSTLGPFGYAVGSGRIRWEAITNLLAGVAIIGTSLALVPRFGIGGAGYSLCTGAVVRCLGVLALWRLDFAPRHTLASFAASAWSPALVGLATLAVLSVAHDRWAPAPSWAGLPAGAALVLLASAALQLAAGELLPGGAGRRQAAWAALHRLRPGGR